MLLQVVAALSGGGALAFAALAVWLAVGRGKAETRGAVSAGELAAARSRLALMVAEHVAYQRHVEQQLAAKEETIAAYISLLPVAIGSGGDPRAVLAAVVLSGQDPDAPNRRPETGVLPDTGDARARLAAVTSSVLGPKPRGGLLGRLTGRARRAVDGDGGTADPGGV